MREIKFRSWDKLSKKMSNPYNLQRQPTFNSEYEGQFCISTIKPSGWLGFDSLSENERQIALQYTGLKDKNDVEIYESDIIKAIWSKDCDEYIANEEWIGDIFFNYGSFDINGEWCVSLNCFNGTLEVIGNIYENPELLESK